jgi:transposase-like protein
MAKATTTNVLSLRPPFDLRALIRERLKEAVEGIFEEELSAALGAGRHERGPARRGYRNGGQERLVLTECGPREMEVPRGRVVGEDGEEREWHSALLPRYQRRTRRVEETILGCYFSGTNTRRIRKALSPLFGEELLSKSAISRIVGKLKGEFESWRKQDLSKERCTYLYLDALRLPIRMARRVVKVPVLVALAVREDGQKALLSLGIAGSESTASWEGFVQDLAGRGLKAPALVILDGNPGLLRATRECWPTSDIQRCTEHKLRNLLSKAPKHCHEELRRDFRTITHGESAEEIKNAYGEFLSKWKKLLPEVAKSLQEAGEELLTFTKYPQNQWKALRTTNRIERLNGEFRRRTKTQGSFRNEGSALVLLWGLVAFGQIRLRKIDGWKEIERVAEGNLSQAA